MRKSFLPPFGKILSTSLLLSFLGGGGLAFIIIFFEPTLGPRWMFFFFLIIFASGIALPGSFIIQRRFAKDFVPSRVLVREAILFGVYLSLLAWLQLGRVLTNLIIAIIGVGFLLFEMLLRMAEKAAFNPEGDEEI